MKSSNGENVAFKTIKKNKKTYKPCPVCKKTNHKEEDCFIKKKQEKSDCNSEKDKNKNKETKQNSRCSYCKKINHSEENCWFKPGGKYYKNGEDKVAFFSYEEKEVHMTEEENTENTKDLVMNSVCTGHMCNEVDLLNNLKSMTVM